MTGPWWLTTVLAAVMLLIAASCAARLVIRLVRGRNAEAEGDVLHVVMGLAMAGMLDRSFTIVPATAWMAVFAGGACWFALAAGRALTGRSRRGWQCAHPAPHAVESAAMLYMLWPAWGAARSGAMAMPGMHLHATANPAIAFMLALFMLGYILWTTDQVASRARRPATAGHALAPTLSASYQIVMGAAMSYMLITMM